VSAPILVVGATGTVGKHVVRRLVEAGRSVRALARNVDNARAQLGPLVEIIGGDLNEPGSLRAALHGVAVASLATAPGPTSRGRRRTSSTRPEPRGCPAW
jgi:uncharacterized protein YbjT (DUF2867 family)